MELKELVGKHLLSGVEENSIQVKEDNRHDELSQTFSFILDGKVYTAIEDPEDGYRSSMRELQVDKFEVKNKFQDVEVLCVMKESNNYQTDDVLLIYDVKTGKIIIEVGTDNIDDYPGFVNTWNPGNLCLNN